MPHHAISMCYFVLSQSTRVTDGQTDGRTDGRTDIISTALAMRFTPVDARCVNGPLGATAA